MAEVRSESSTEGLIAKDCKHRGIYCRKNTGQKGIPDRELLYLGCWLKLEIKKLGEEPSELQKDEIDIINRHGGFATWCDSRASAKEVIDELVLYAHGEKNALRGICNLRNNWKE